MPNIFKVPDIKCLITGTDDTSDGQQEQCKLCSYKQMCTAKYNEQELIEAQELLEESRRYEDEAKQLKERSNMLFAKVLNDNGLYKFQFNHYIISNIVVHDSKQYPKEKLLKVFTLEQLEPASEIKKGYSYLRVDDLLKAKKVNNA